MWVGWGGAGGYVSFGCGYAGVEGGYVAACRKVRLLDRKARIVQIKPHSLVRRYPTRGIAIITGNRPRDPCSSVWKCALCRRSDQTIGRASCRERVGRYGMIWVVAESLKQKHKKKTESEIIK